jgi:hypothetical protein
MRKAPHISVWWERDEYSCRFSYSHELVDFLRSLPKKDRRFNDEEKTWSFRAKHLDSVLLECRHLGFRIEREGEEYEPQSRTDSSATETLLVSFFRLVPKSAMRAAYLKAALALHPDRGGSTADMQQLNSLWQRIEKEFYAPK